MGYRTRRTARKGGILAMAMLFFVMVTVAGTAILSMSTIQRIKTVRNGIDVRLMIAAESGIETLRGRFTLVKGVQDDWNWVSDSTWTNLGTINVNGIAVQTQAQRSASQSVPRARLRARASAAGKTRVVEITVRVASFSDYSVFGTGGQLGQDYKLVGNMYANGDIDVPYTGARIYGRTELTGSVTGTYSDPLDAEYPFVNENPVNVSAIPFPTDLAEWDYMKDVAETTGYVYAENTLEIVFNGTSFTRYYVRRRNTATAGAGALPTGQIDNSGSTWINPINGATNYSSSRLNNADYELVSETIDIPDEGVIYVQSGPASAIADGPLTGNPWFRDSLASSPRINGFVQQHWLHNVTSSNSHGSPNGYYEPYHHDRRIFWNNNSGYGYSTGYTPILLISGVIDARRVTLVCDHKIIVKQCIAYQGLLDNPDLRRYFDDGMSGKQSSAAINMHEMLGVMSKSEIHPTPTWWNPLPVSARVSGDLAGETVPGHDHTDIKSNGADYSMDGVYLAWGSTNPQRMYWYPSYMAPLGEMWFCGGLITQGDYGGGNGNTFKRRGYDWDYRMAITMPPYFLRAYNVTARFVPGTWRTWTE